MKKSAMKCRPTTWRGRAACLLGNDLVEVIHLTGGGHIVDFHFVDPASINPFWVPQWRTQEPYHYRSARDSGIFGASETGRLLSGIAGHSLCLDLFGMPSAEESRLGASLHGEAGIRKWKADFASTRDEATLKCSVNLPAAGLAFTRTLSLRRGESVVRVHETVRNQRSVDQFIQWQQHATLGPPFLDQEACRLELSGGRGLTHPAGYEGRELLARGAEFVWPHAPTPEGGRVDLRRSLSVEGRGFIAGVQFAPERDHAFLCAVNAKFSLAIGYYFRRADYPWVVLWEENRVRDGSPWHGREQTRALEFGASPLPLTRAQTIQQGEIFGMSTLVCVPAKSERAANYLLFLARLPQDASAIVDVVSSRETLDIFGSEEAVACSLPASGIGNFLN
jgi:hypothetical protein